MTTTCVHHWICQPANGPTSKARCKKCGDQAEFANSITYNTWRLASKGQQYGRKGKRK